MQGMVPGGESLTDAPKPSIAPNSTEKMAGSKVIDAWALLAWVRNEQPAAESVRLALQAAEDGGTPLSHELDKRR